MSVGSKIKQARAARGWVQRELAHKVGVEPPTVSRWENDEVEPEPRNLVALAEALGKPAEWFQEANQDKDIEEIKKRLAELEALKAALEAPKKTYALTSDERRLIDIFREARDAKTREEILYLAGMGLKVSNVPSAKPVNQAKGRRSPKAKGSGS